MRGTNELLKESPRPVGRGEGQNCELLHFNTKADWKTIPGALIGCLFSYACIEENFI